MARNTEIPGGAQGRLIRVGKGEDPCWEWLGKPNGRDYPRRVWMGKELSARRWMYLLLFGRIPARNVLEAKCGNRNCVNPQHMRLISIKQAQRMGDGTILLQSDVDAMRLRLAHPEAKFRRQRKAMIDQLCEEYGIQYTTAICAISNRSWHDPKLPTGIANLIAHFEKNPPCANTSSSSSTPTTEATPASDAPTTKNCRRRSRTRKPSPEPPATKFLPSLSGLPAPLNGER